MKRLVVLLASLAAALSTAAPGHAGSAERHRYVANDFASFVLAGFSQSSGIAVDGTVLFKARDSYATVKVADAVAHGTVPLLVNTTDGARWECVRVGRPTRIDGLVAGEWVGLTLLDATFHASCRAGATAGMLWVS